jgi:hypothetical protein
MGIRYYAYAFDAHLTAQALAEPHSILSDDPLAEVASAAEGPDAPRPGADEREAEGAYAAHYLARAKKFVTRLADEHRGMVYTIG